MSIKIGNTDINKIYIGNTEIGKVYLGKNLIYDKTIPVANIISQWKFDGNVLDTVGSNDGVATNITYTTGQVGQSASFNGTSSDVTIPNATNLSIFSNGFSNKAGSITLGVKFNTLPTTGFILNKRGTPSTANREYWVRYNAGQIVFIIYDEVTDGTIRVSYPWIPTLGVWYHFSFTSDGSGLDSGLKMYLNGVSVGTNSTTGLFFSCFSGVGDLVFGKAAFASSNYADIDTDETYLWDVGLTSSQSLAIYNKFNNGQTLI